MYDNNKAKTRSQNSKNTSIKWYNFILKQIDKLKIYAINPKTITHYS